MYSQSWYVLSWFVLLPTLLIPDVQKQFWVGRRKIQCSRQLWCWLSWAGLGSLLIYYIPRGCGMHRTGPSCSKLLTTENRYGSKAVIKSCNFIWSRLLSCQYCCTRTFSIANKKVPIFTFFELRFCPIYRGLYNILDCALRSKVQRLKFFKDKWWWQLLNSQIFPSLLWKFFLCCSDSKSKLSVNSC